MHNILPLKVVLKMIQKIGIMAYECDSSQQMFIILGWSQSILETKKSTDMICTFIFTVDSRSLNKVKL